MVKSRIIIFGGGGMLGRYVREVLNEYRIFTYENRNDLDLRDVHAVKLALKNQIGTNDIIVNCAGVIPHKEHTKEDMVLVNTVFPLLLDKMPNKVIHISTDCVFNGKELKPYSEQCIPNDTSDYGKTKALGEPLNKTVIRTSIVGQGGGLLQWLREQNSGLRLYTQGYSNHYWNGVTCLTLANIIKQMIEQNDFWIGARHIFSPDVCTKFILLQYINDVYNLQLNIRPTDHEHMVYRVLTNWHDDCNRDIMSIKDQIKEQLEWHDEY